MRPSFKSAIAGVATLAVAVAMAAAGASSAAAADPSLTTTSDPNEYGTISFYDAAGNQLFGGDGTVVGNPAYVVASTQHPVAAATKTAALVLYNPVTGVVPGLWNGTPLNGNVTYPIITAPAPVVSSPNPASSLASGDSSLFVAQKAFAAKPAPLTNVYQVRLVNKSQVAYAAATVTIDSVTGAWAQTFPVPTAPPKATTTTLSANPTSGVAPTGTTLTATVATSPPGGVPVGSVQFFEGTTPLGASPVAAGTAIQSVTNISLGSHSYTATFTPTDPAGFAPSTSTAATFTATKPAPSISLASSSAAPAVGAQVTFTATIGQVASANVAGTVQFFDGTVSLGTVTATNNSATVSTSALAAGAHSVTATFTPTDTANFGPATSAPVSVTVLAGACTLAASQCTDPQSFTAVVPVGSLSISTPFHTNNPFNLGTLALNSQGTQLSSGAKSFASQDPTGKGITIVDTRSGNVPWTANLQSSSFTSGANSIAAKNLGFTNITPTYIANNALQSPAVTVPAAGFPANDVYVPAAGLESSVTFASATRGVGSVYVNGDFTLNAPTSIPAGTYSGTVTFTIS